MNYMSRSFLIVFMLATIFAASCGSCDSSQPEAQTEPQAESPAPEDEADRAAEEAANRLKEATEQAEVLGGQVGFDRMTAARFLSSELEGMQKEVKAPKVKRAPRPKDDGEIDLAGVKRVFNARHGELQACYERALKGDPSLAGAVTLTVRIGKGGLPKLTRARSNELRSKSALNCMEQASKKWRFPAPEGGTVLINKPYTFKPKI